MDHYADKETGVYLGATDTTPPPNSVKTPAPPDASYLWDGSKWVAPPGQPWQVDQERDRRIAAGFTHAGKTYDSNPESMRRIDKAYAVACRALVEGAKAGNLRWADAAQDFRWIAKDNSYVTMDAPTVVTFGEAAAAWETKHIYRARELKSMSPIPTDYTADKYWS